MNAAFLISYVVLWAMMLAMSGAVFVLYRYIGSLYLNTREGHLRQGPEMLKRMPPMHLTSMAGDPLTIGRPAERPKLVMLVDVHCKSCRVLVDSLPALFELRSEEIDLIVICGGGASEVKAFTSGLPASIPVVADVRGLVPASYRITVTPFALTIDNNGVVQYKGVPGTDLKGLERCIAPVITSSLAAPKPVANPAENGGRSSMTALA